MESKKEFNRKTQGEEIEEFRSSITQCNSKDPHALILRLVDLYINCLERSCAVLESTGYKEKTLRLYRIVCFIKISIKHMINIHLLNELLNSTNEMLRAIGWSKFATIQIKEIKKIVKLLIIKGKNEY